MKYKSALKKLEMDYCNYRYQWDLEKCSPVEYRIYFLEGGNHLLHKKETNREPTQLASN